MSNDFNWDDIFEKNTWGKYPPESLIRFVAKNIDNPLSKLLEVGCGTGTNLLYFLKEGFTCHGIDNSQIAIDRANILLEKFHSKFQLQKTDVRQLNFKIIDYDVFIDNETCYTLTLDDASSVYRNAYENLNKGGLMYIKTFSTDTSAVNEGTLLDDGRVIASRGPLKDLGPSRFTSHSELREILDFASDVEVNSHSYTMNDGDFCISELVASVRK